MSSKPNTIERSRSQPSLARLIFVSHFVLAAIILIGFAVVMFAMNYRAAYAKVESELLGAAEVLSNDLEQGVAPEKLQLPDAFFHRFGKASRDHAYWRLWDDQGHVIVSHGDMRNTIEPHPTPPPTNGKHPYVKRFAGRHFEMLIAMPKGGQLLVGRPMAKEFDGFVRQLTVLAAVILLGLLAAAGIAWWLTIWIVRPISNLAHAAGEITPRQLDRRLHSPQSTSEMTVLTNSFNTMLKGLQTAFLKQRQFTSDAAHELRTPVAIVLGQCELSLSKPREPEHYRQSLMTCLQSAAHMRVLVDQLLQLTRLEGNACTDDRVQTDLSEVLIDAVQMLTPLALQQGITLQTSTKPSCVLANSTQMRQVIINLISNAIQFSSAGDYVHVSVTPAADEAVVTVRDTGIGIAEEDLPRVCDRFFRVDKARTTTGTSGTGLGLSIVAEIVAAHAGEITIQSQVGSGTTVRVAIPLAPSPKSETVH